MVVLLLVVLVVLLLVLVVVVVAVARACCCCCCGCCHALVALEQGLADGARMKPAGKSSARSRKQAWGRRVKVEVRGFRIWGIYLPENA